MIDQVYPTTRQSWLTFHIIWLTFSKESGNLDFACLTSVLYFKNNGLRSLSSCSFHFLSEKIYYELRAGYFKTMKVLVIESFEVSVKVQRTGVSNFEIYATFLLERLNCSVFISYHGLVRTTAKRRPIFNFRFSIFNFFLFPNLQFNYARKCRLV